MSIVRAKLSLLVSTYLPLSSSLSEKELYGELLINGGQCSNYSEFMVGNDWMIETQNVNSSMDLRISC